MPESAEPSSLEPETKATDEPEGQPLAAVAPAVKPGTQLGRFVVISELGQGGMGAVYAAFDPQLNRRVAIKLLRPDAASRNVERAAARLQREAQALARVSHSNVVSVYEVGVQKGGVFIAMEFVEGLTLDDWLRDQPRPVVLKAFCEAGEGLWAIHQAGLVHRDFKAANVVVAHDGRVKLLDLGLARLSSDSEKTESSPGHSSSSGKSSESSGSLDTPLTEVGHFSGTLGFIAPEILKGEVATALSDQFSFGAALYRGLVGKLPYKARNLTAYALALRKGPPEAPPKEAHVPPWLWAVVRRTLSAKPEERFASMAEVLKALRSDPSQVRRRRLAGVVASVTLLATGYGVVAATDSGCQTASQLLEPLWPNGSLSRLEETLSAQRAGLRPMVQRGLSTLDQHIRQWAAAKEQTCRAEHPRFAPATTSRRSRCLERRGMEFSVLVDTLSRADELLAKKVAELIDETAVDPACLRHLDRRTADDVEDSQRAIAGQLRLDLLRARALELTGHFTEGLQLARSVAERARAHQLTGFEGEAMFRSSALERDLGKQDASDASIRSALYLTLTAGLDDQAFQSAIILVKRLRKKEGQLAQSKEFLRLAEAVFGRLGGSADLKLELIGARISIALAEHRTEEVVELSQQIFDVARREFGEYSKETSYASAQQSFALWGAGRFSESVKAAERTVRIMEALLGKDDPRLVFYYDDLATSFGFVGRDAESAPLLERALDLASRTLDPNSIDITNVMWSLAIELANTNPARALSLANSVVERFEQAQVPSKLRQAYQLRGRVLANLRRGAEALADCDRAGAVKDPTADLSNINAPQDARCRGNALHALGRAREAVRELERARRLLPASTSPGARALVTLELARATLAAGAPVQQVRELCAQGLADVASFPLSSEAKRELSAFLNSLSAQDAPPTP